MEGAKKNIQHPTFKTQHPTLAHRYCWMLGVLFSVLVLSGCVSKSTAQAKERAAFLAGQQEAIARMQQMQSQTQGPSVIVNGDVRNRGVPWSEGMTVAKALIAADYTGASDPSQIIVVHQGIARRIELQQLLSGKDIPLDAGDILQLVPQGSSTKP